MNRLRMQLFSVFAMVMIVALALPVLYGRQTMHRDLLEDMRKAALGQAMALANALSDRSLAGEELRVWIGKMAAQMGVRITFVNTNGQVLAESSQDSSALPALPSHNDRPEISGAESNGAATAVRHSNTLKLDMIYAAVRVAALDERPEGVLRVAMPFAGIAGRVDTMTGRLAVFGLLALLLAFWLSRNFLTQLERAIADMTLVVEHTARPETEHRPTLPARREFAKLSVAVSDMTERVTAQLNTIAEQKAELEVMLDSLEEGVLVLGERGRIRRVNPALCRLFPSLTKDNPLGRLPVEALPLPELLTAINDVQQGGKTESSLTLELGQYTLSVHISRPAVPVHGVSAVVVLHDVSAMAGLIRIKRDLVANVSHELRTPLTAIQGYAETLLEIAALPANDKNLADQRKFAEIIRKNSMRMSRLVEDLLLLSRLESGDNQMEAREVDPLPVLEEAAQECSLAERGLNMVIRFHPGPVLADKDRLEQIFRNLLENACRYAEGGTDIVAACEPENGMMRFTVQDFGPGIPESELVQIFDRFHRVEKHRGGGTGLGLSLCKHMVERMGGRIWAEIAAPLIPNSRPAGATLCFTLPMAGQGE